MEQYIELYNDEFFKLYVNYYLPEVPDGYSCLMIKIEKQHFSGTGSFYWSDEYKQTILNSLCHMNTTLSGECVIQDYESTNSFHIFFAERQLCIKGKLSLDEFGDTLTFEGHADQTILSPLITILQNN